MKVDQLSDAKNSKILSVTSKSICEEVKNPNDNVKNDHDLIITFITYFTLIILIFLYYLSHFTFLKVNFILKIILNFHFSILELVITKIFLSLWITTDHLLLLINFQIICFLLLLYLASKSFIKYYHLELIMFYQSRNCSVYYHYYFIKIKYLLYWKQ